MNMFLKKCVGIMLVWAIAAPLPAETLKLLTYHDHPPFITGPHQGKTYDLADRLNQAAEGRFQFEVVVVPRSRLNVYIQEWIQGNCPGPACKEDWLVPWVNPKWGFIKGASDPYFWQPQFADSNVIISRADDGFEYRDPTSLKGKVFAGIRGHRYVGIDELVDVGQIKRIDGDHERDNLNKLLYKRVDVTLLPSSSMTYFLRQDPALANKAPLFHLSAIKHQTYQRNLMIPSSRQDLKHWLETLPPLNLE